MLKMEIRINGSGENPWHIYQLKQNPFPQLGIYEYNAFDQMVNSLDGDPIKSEDDIRERLKGCSEEFIKLCISAYQPGHRVRFCIQFPR